MEQCRLRFSVRSNKKRIRIKKEIIMGNCKDGHCSIDKTKKGMDTSQKRGYIRASVSFVLLITGIVFSAVNLPFFEKDWIRLV